MEKKFSLKNAAAYLQAETVGNEIHVKDVYRRMPEGPIHKTFIKLCQTKPPRRVEMFLSRFEDAVQRSVGDLPMVNQDIPWSIQERVRQLYEFAGVVEGESVTDAVAGLSPDIVKVVEYHYSREHSMSHIMQVYYDTLQVLIREEVDAVRMEWESSGRSWAPVVQLAKKLYPQVEYEVPRIRHAAKIITV